MKRQLFLVLALLSLAVTPLAGAQEKTDKATAETPASADAGAMEQRLQRLEDAIIDIQSMVGALETMVQSGDTASSPSAITATPPQDSRGLTGGTDAAGDGNLAVLEIQVRALSGQLSDITQRLARIENHLGLSSGDTSGVGRRGEAEGAATAPAAAATTFGTVSVEPQEPADSGPTAGQPGSPADADATSSPEARRLYEQAYDLLRQRDYPAAERTFAAFLKQYPDDALAGSAQFWLGEAAFVNGDYKRAANMFVKAYNASPQGAKAAESLLKLGISLRRLGENDRACQAFSRLEGQFGAVSEGFTRQLEREKRRAGC